VRHPRFVAAASVIAVFLAAGSARAYGPPAASAAPAAPAPAPPAPALPTEVRLGMSVAASEQLGSIRVRRLLDIELEDSAALAPGVTGPLGDHIAHVWIDLPDPSRVTVQVRMGERPVARREVPIGGLTFDVAARLVAISTSEMVRAQARPRAAPKRPAPPKGPTPEELEISARGAPAVTLSSAFGIAALPSASGLLAGPSIALGFRNFGASERVFCRWLGGSAEPGTMRWFEAGLAADYRIWLSPSWRVALGASASLSWLHFAQAIATDEIPGEQDTWSARAGAALALEARITRSAWVSLAAEPGVILRAAPYEIEGGVRDTLEGAWIGADLSLHFEVVSSRK
jgi:hypothetical protein